MIAEEFDGGSDQGFEIEWLRKLGQSEMQHLRLIVRDGEQGVSARQDDLLVLVDSGVGEPIVRTAA